MKNRKNILNCLNKLLLFLSLMLLELQGEEYDYVYVKLEASLHRTDGGCTLGDWQNFVYCPKNTFVNGYRMRVEQSKWIYGILGIKLHLDLDYTALNSIEMKCIDLKGNFIRNINSYNGDWGNWYDYIFCPMLKDGAQSFMTGYIIKEGPNESGAEGMRSKCIDGNIIEAPGTYDYDDGGNWGNIGECPSGTAICGFSIKYQLKNTIVGVFIDDSAMNFMKVACCKICDPDKGLYLETKNCAQCHYSCKTCQDGSSLNMCTSCYFSNSSHPHILNSDGTCTIQNYEKVITNEVLPDRWDGIPNTVTSYTTCDIFSLLGGFNIGSNNNISKIFREIPPYFRVRIWFRFVKIDYWNQEKLYVNVNSYQAYDSRELKASDDYYLGNICGKTDNEMWNEYSEMINFEFMDAKTSDTLLVKISTNLNQDSLKNSWGFSHFTLSILSCYNTCRTCFDEKKTSCLTCYENSIKLPDNTCVCSEGFFQLTDSPCVKYPCTTCNPCKEGCKICDKTLNCTHCFSGFYLHENSCLRSCPNVSFFEDNTNNLCSKCNEDCLTCSGGSGVECLKCINETKPFKENSLLQPGRCLAMCDSDSFGLYIEGAGVCQSQCPEPLIQDTKYRLCRTCFAKSYFNTSSYQCMPCDTTCKTCEGPSSTECLSCDVKYLFQGSCINECGLGYSENIITRKCDKCNSTCMTCNATDSVNNCTSCPDGLFIKDNVCYRICPEGFWGVKSLNICKELCDSNMFSDSFTRTCEPCNPLCLTCSTQSTNCTECFQNFFLDYNTRTCVNKCPNPSEYGDLNKKMCLKCGSNCKTCEDNNIKCTSCSPPFYLEKSLFTCVDNCAIGEYADQNSNYCLPCDDACSECNTTATNCYSCNKGYYLYEYKCVSKCPEPLFGVDNDRECLAECLATDEYGDLKLRICKKCDKVCQTCNQASNTCTSCYAPLFLSRSQYTCVDICPEDLWGVELSRTCEEKCNNDEYGDIGNSRICSKCDSECLTCFGQKYFCLSCPNNKFLYNNTCPNICPKPFFGDNEKSVCVEQCPLTNQYGDPFGRVCKNCSSNCKTCKELASNCTSCVFPLFWINIGDLFYCGQQCPQGYWGINNQTCVKACPANQYPDKIDRICKNCSSSCKTCSSISECSSCDITRYLSLDRTCVNSCDFPSVANNQTNTCNETCLNPNEFPNSNRFCESCDKNCMCCDGPGPNNCSLCSDSYFFYSPSSCMSVCPDGYLGSYNDFKCHACPKGCKACIDNPNLDCKECVEGYLLYKPNMTCLTSCPDGYYKNIDMKECELCNSSCVKCTGGSANECQDCSLNYFLYKTTCLLKEDCPYGNYVDLGNKLCLPCDENCTACRNRAYICTECSGDRFLLNSNCVNPCPEGFYSEKLNNTCAHCNLNCTKCFGSRISECFSCVDNLLLDEKTCTDKCPDGKFVNSESKTCDACHESCKTCSGPLETDCKSCGGQLAYLVQNSTCLLNCPFELWKDSDNNECIKKCHYTCKGLSCSAYNSSMCNECAGNREFKELGKYENKTGYGYCACPSEFYGNDARNNSTDPLCSRCYKNCLTCFGPEKNNCIKCKDLMLIKDNTCDCPLGYLEEGVCKDCHTTCYTCNGTNSTDCLSCLAPYVLQTEGNSKKGFCYCPAEGYFINSGLCLACHKSCRTCDSTESDGCLTCPEGQVRTENKECVCPESPKYVLSNACCIGDDLTNAGICPSNKPINCFDCKAGFILKEGSCVCENGLYNDNNICSKCHHSCGDCTGPGRGDCLKTCSSITRGRNGLAEDGQCDCMDLYEDNLIPECAEKAPVQKVLENVQNTVAKTSGVASSISGVSGGAGAGGGAGGIGILGILEISQMMSLAGNMKMDYPLSLDKNYLKPLAILRMDEIFDFSNETASYSKNTTNRILYVSSNLAISHTRMKSIVFILGINLASMLIILMIIIISNRVRNIKIRKFFEKILIIIRWRLFFCIFRVTSLAQIIFILNELSAESNISFYGLTGKTLAITLAVIQIMFILYSIWAVNFKNFENEDVRNSYGFLIEGIDSIFLTKKNYSNVISIRKLSTCAIFVCMVNNVELQSLFLIGNQLIFMIYLFITKPFITATLQRLQILFESLLLLFYIGLAVLLRYNDKDARIIIGWSLIVLLLVLQISMLVAALMNFIGAIKNTFFKNTAESREGRKRSAKGKVVELEKKGWSKDSIINVNGMQTIILNKFNKGSKKKSENVPAPHNKRELFFKDTYMSKTSHQIDDSLVNSSIKRKSLGDPANEKNNKNDISENLQEFFKPSNSRIGNSQTACSNIGNRMTKTTEIARSSMLLASKKGYTERVSLQLNDCNILKKTSVTVEPNEEDSIKRLIEEEKKNRVSDRELLENYSKKFYNENNNIEDSENKLREFPCEAILKEDVLVRNKKYSFNLEKGFTVTVIKGFPDVGIAEISCENGFGYVSEESLEYI